MIPKTAMVCMKCFAIIYNLPIQEGTKKPSSLNMLSRSHRLQWLFSITELRDTTRLVDVVSIGSFFCFCLTIVPPCFIFLNIRIHIKADIIGSLYLLG